MILLDGGYDTNYRVQIWLVSEGNSMPQPNPSLSEKTFLSEKESHILSLTVQKLLQYISDLEILEPVGFIVNKVFQNPPFETKQFFINSLPKINDSDYKRFIWCR